VTSDGAPGLLLADLAAIVGAGHVLTGASDIEPFLTEPRGYYHGRALAVVRPGSTAEVAALLRLANLSGSPVVPQGGNTGLVGAQVPDESGRELVLSTVRLDRVRAIDPAGGTIVAEAGVALEALQTAAAGAGMLFPLSLGSQGSCRIGGNISTNAGGTAVLAYGNARSLVLGLEVVLPTGEIWDGLRSLLKDNAGYDLKQLFIGSEGTLGVVTAAVLKLFPQPRGEAAAFVGLPSPAAALGLFGLAREQGGGGLTGFELLPRVLVKMIVDHLPGAREPLASPHPWYVLLELSSSRSQDDARALIEGVLAEGLARDTVTDATIASSLDQAASFWRMRHAATEVQRFEGGSIKHDVSVPVQRIPEFLQRGSEALARIVPGVRPVPFGHMGDGNIHFNASQPVGMERQAFMDRAPEVHAAIHAIVVEMGGSVAAEHGVGRYKRELLTSVRSELELDLMRRIKRSLDPNGILNPGRVIEV
jgi:FAD/FMN-containing dehydrogenase